MSRLPVVGAARMEKVLLSLGFAPVRQPGVALLLWSVM
jgi:predicted RNA binding protein YcfA (HicA-like mRNA interferase family)